MGLSPKTPEAEASKNSRKKIEELGITEPKNLEEQALSLAGRFTYEKLVLRVMQEAVGT
ncbi:MAG: hypothetical protein ACLVIY_01565 [Anaerobutyricum soehngenii]